MIKLLAKIFIKSPKEYSNPDVRRQYGILCGGFGIFLNILLFAAKLAAGIFSKSVAVIADAFNNLSDSAASFITIAGFKLSGQKPDAEHPFGHGRMEYIAGMVVSFLILMFGLELMKSSVKAVLHPEPLDSSVFTFGALILSILVKFYMFVYNMAVAKKIDSATMKATAKDSLNDTISTFVVLAVIVVTLLFPELKIPLDGIAGIVVAVFIILSGIDAAKETINPLLGVKADPEFAEKIEKCVMAHKPVCGIHDLIVHDYGSGRLMISVHAEVPGDMDIYELHEVIDNAEVDLAREFNCHAVIHMDPVDVNNPEIAKIKAYINGVLPKIAPDLSAHDFRMVPGEDHTNVIFDVVRPMDCALSEDELKMILREKIKEYNASYNAVICVDNPFV